MLEMLASGNIAEFIDLAVGSDYIRHLVAYGLVDNADTKNPSIKLPVVRMYANNDRVRRDRTQKVPYVIPLAFREAWLLGRVARITGDVRQLERIAVEHSLPRLYGQNGYPEAERFSSLKLVIGMESFDTFINICNRCFVESIERLGISINKKRYFWDEIKVAYPDFWHALFRIKLYRHERMHLALTEKVEEQLQGMISSDFLGYVPERVEERYFMLQQFVLDGLFAATQIEMDKFL